ncbi:MAG: hypothetical protein K2M07_04415 [Muribaculaceae bacterium]|nr:hypothetical protein [Muribaculaceae bacterium]
MNIKYSSLTLALAALTLGSCAKHDIIGDKAELGQRVPTAYWEVGSTTCKAGEDFTFKGKYYTEDGHTPDHAEVWYSVERAESAAATVKLPGNTLSYTQTVNGSEIVRSNQMIASFPHSMGEWDGHEYVLNASVPTSSTLSPVDWKSPKEWDQDKYDTYYPAEFAQEFCDKVVEYLTKDSTYLSALQNTYINYPFTNEQFAAVNAKYNVDLPTDIDQTKPEADKSDRWFTTRVHNDSKVVGYYYTSLDANGVTVVHEVPLDYVNPDVNLYPVYSSSPWLFCRYDDEVGAIINSVRAAYMPAFKELVQQISFQDWIYDSSNQCYSVTFARTYSLESTFHVIDTEGNRGKAADIRVISIN